MAEAKKKVAAKAKRSTKAAPEPKVAVRALGQKRRCTVCGTITDVELCPVDGSKMIEMDVADA